MQRSKPSALLELPGQLHGGDLPGLFASFGFDAANVGGDRWSVRAATVAGQRHLDLVTARTLAGPQRRDPQFDILARSVDTLPSYQLSPQIQARLAALRAAAQDPDAALPVRLAAVHQEFQLANTRDCREIVEQAFEVLGHCVLENTTTPLLPDRSAHLVTATPTLYHRMQLPSVVLRLVQDPQLINEIQTQATQLPTDGRVFASASEQSNSLVLAGSFLGPLLGCLLPFMWAYPCSRLTTTVVFGFGRALNATAGKTTALLDSLPVRGRTSSAALPMIGRNATEAAIDWWVMRLNQLFRYLTDPATYIDSRGFYVPHEQLHWMLTIDQVLRLTTSLQATVGDSTGQRMLAFTLLGSFADRLFDTRVELRNLCNLTYARSQFDLAKAAMPPAAREVLLPAAQRALDALEQLQEGFFIVKQRGEKVVTIQLPGGVSKTMNLQDAAAKLLVVHRNATHGYGGLATPKNRQNAEINERLLAQHDGKIPDDVALLPYLYLLAALSRPEDIRDRITSLVVQL